VRKFHFSLEPLCRVRTLAVRQREVSLARAREELERAEKARMEKEEELRSLLRQSPRGTLVQVRELLELDAERLRLRSLLRRAERELADSTEQVESERSHLLQARRDEKVVGKLRERRYLEYTREAQKQEQKSVDEVASRMKGRQRAA